MSEHRELPEREPRERPEREPPERPVIGLDEQLRRFHAAITGDPPAFDEAAALIEESCGVSATRRLHVYAHAYVARLADVLAADFPKLTAVHPDLRALTAAYLRAFPPSHPSVREVGAHLAPFLAERGEDIELVDLAALERARVEAFDGGADVTPLTRDDVARVAPEDFPAIRLQLVPSHRLVAMASRADELWDAVEQGQPPPAPAPAPAPTPPRCVLVWRRGVTVIHRTLEPDEAALAPSLAAGTTFGEACEVLQDAERAVALLLRWLDAAVLRADPS